MSKKKMFHTQCNALTFKLLHSTQKVVIHTIVKSQFQTGTFFCVRKYKCMYVICAYKYIEFRGNHSFTLTVYTCSER